MSSDDLRDVPPDVLAAADMMRIEFDRKIGGAPLALAVKAYRRGVNDTRALIDRSGDALIRAELAALLRRCAAGRREYAGMADSPNSKDPTIPAVAELMRIQALTLDAAARAIEGDLGPLYDWLPSHRWTAEMTDALYPERKEGGAGGA